MSEKRKPQEFTAGLFGFEVPISGRVIKKAHKHEKEKDPNDNPMVRAYGPHMDPRLRCKDCNHLFVMEYALKNNWKCQLRKLTHGQLADHRKHWPACMKFETFNPDTNHNIITNG